MAARDSDWLRHFRLLLKNHCMDCHQTCHKCSSNGPADVLLLFVVIGNPRWPPWTLIGWDIFDFFSRTTACTGTKVSTNGLLVVLKKCCYFLLWSEIQDGRHGLWLAETFFFSKTIAWLLLKNHCFDCHQTCQKHFSNGPAEVLLLFVAIGNPRWPPWTLIGWDIFDFWRRTTTCTGTKLSRNVPLVVLKKCCYFSFRSEI